MASEPASVTDVGKRTSQVLARVMRTAIVVSDVGQSSHVCQEWSLGLSRCGGLGLPCDAGVGRWALMTSLRHEGDRSRRDGGHPASFAGLRTLGPGPLASGRSGPAVRRGGRGAYVESVTVQRIEGQ